MLTVSIKGHGSDSQVFDFTNPAKMAQALAQGSHTLRITYTKELAAQADKPAKTLNVPLGSVHYTSRSGKPQIVADVAKITAVLAAGRLLAQLNASANDNVNDRELSLPAMLAALDHVPSAGLTWVPALLKAPTTTHRKLAKAVISDLS